MDVRELLRILDVGRGRKRRKERLGGWSNKEVGATRRKELYLSVRPSMKKIKELKKSLNGASRCHADN